MKGKKLLNKTPPKEAPDIVVVVHEQSVFLPVKKVAEMFFSTTTTVRRNLKLIEENPRYANAWISLNEDGDKLINSLVYTDFLKYKSVLKEKNLAKRLPEFSEAEVQARRGDYRKLVKIEGQ